MNNNELINSKIDKNSIMDEEKDLFLKLRRISNEITITTLRNAYTCGQLISCLYKKQYGKDTFSLIAEHTSINKNTLYRYCQVADVFNDIDIDLFCDGGELPLSFRYLKANMKLGRETIVELFSKSSTLADFKHGLKNLGAPQKESKPNDENCPTGTKSEPESEINAPEVVDTNNGDENQSEKNDDDILEHSENAADSGSIINEDVEKNVETSEDETSDIGNDDDENEDDGDYVEDDEQTKQESLRADEVKQNCGTHNNLEPLLDEAKSLREMMVHENVSNKNMDTACTSTLEIEEELKRIREENVQLKNENTRLKEMVEELTDENNE